MHALESVDYAILGLYLLATAVIGLLMTSKAAKSLDHYYLGGRSIPWYLLGVAGMANWFDLTGTMIITSFLYMLGPRGLFIEFRGGACLVLAFMLAYTGKWHRRSGCMTGAEWLTYRFGEGRSAEAVRFMTAAMGILVTLGMLAYLVRGTSLFMGVFFPFPPVLMTALVIGLATLYTMCAGFYGVVLTDLIQGLIICVSCVVVGVMAWQIVDDSASLASLAAQVTGNSQWTDSWPSLHTEMPSGYEMYESLALFAFFYLLRNVLGGMGTGGESRYFAARSDRECGLQSLLQGVMITLRWPMMIGFAVMGLVLVQEAFPSPDVVDRAAALIHQAYPAVDQAHWHDLTAHISMAPEAHPPSLVEGLRSLLGEGWAQALPLVGYAGAVNPEQILPAVLLHSIPVGLKGLLIVAMLAALMSTLTGTLNGASALFVRDIYQNILRPTAARWELIAVSYLATAGMVVGGFLMGISASSINQLWGWIIMSLTAGGLAPGLLRLYWWRCNAWGIAGGTLLGGVGAVVQRLFWPDMMELHQFMLMTSLSFAGTIVGSLLTPPTPSATLDHFYRTTRPFGWWGKWRRSLPEDERRRLEREHRNDILTVPFVLLAQVTAFLMAMQLVIRSYRPFSLTLPLFLIGVAGMYLFWWRPLAQIEEPIDAAAPPAEAIAASLSQK